jgi:hypothetical protein
MDWNAATSAAVTIRFRLIAAPARAVSILPCGLPTGLLPLKHSEQEILERADVRFGSKADIGLPPGDVRFAPKSGHHRRTLDVR